MATIGRSAAIAELRGGLQLTGFLAWLAWAVVHIGYLIGFRNRLRAMTSWAWNYLWSTVPSCGRLDRRLLVSSGSELGPNDCVHQLPGTWFGLRLVNTLMWAFEADILEYGEWKSAVRTERASRARAADREQVPRGRPGHGRAPRRTGGRRRHARPYEPWIQVILATGIPEARCQCINLGFVDYRGIDLVGAEPSLAARVQPGAY